MTERVFKKAIWSDSFSDDAFNYLFVFVFIVLGFYWLFHFEVPAEVGYKLILRVLSVVLPFLFAISMVRGMALNNKVILIHSHDSIDRKKQLVEDYMATKKQHKELPFKNRDIMAYEYHTNFGIPVYMYVFADDDMVLINVRRKDNFSLREIFDYGLIKRAQNKIAYFFEEKLTNSNNVTL